MSDRTLWHDPVKKFRPRNKQAAMICLPAKGLHVPPDSIPRPVFGMTIAQRIEEENRARREKLSIIGPEWDARKAEVKQREEDRLRRQRQKKSKAKIRPAMQRRKIEKDLIRIHIRRGLAPPTPEQIQRALGGVSRNLVAAPVCTPQNNSRP